MTAFRITELRVGRPRPFGPRGQPSAIDKAPVVGPVPATANGLEGDQQGDTRRHGGPDKAIHAYSAAVAGVAVMSRGFVLYESMLRDERRRASAMQEEFSGMRRRVVELEAANRALAAENRRLQARLARRLGRRGKTKGQASGLA